METRIPARRVEGGRRLGDISADQELPPRRRDPGLHYLFYLYEGPVPFARVSPRPFEERRPMLFYLPIALTALATTLYHIAQNSIVPGVHPMVSLVINYATSLVACLVVVPLAPGGSTLVRSLKSEEHTSELQSPSVI